MLANFSRKRKGMLRRHKTRKKFFVCCFANTIYRTHHIMPPRNKRRGGGTTRGHLLPGHLLPQRLLPKRRLLRLLLLSPIRLLCVGSIGKALTATIHQQKFVKLSLKENVAAAVRDITNEKFWKRIHCLVCCFGFSCPLFPSLL